MDINQGINITISSHGDYEEVLGEIFYDGRAIARLTMESGPSRMQIEFFPWPPEAPDEPIIVPLTEFEEALQRLKGELLR